MVFPCNATCGMNGRRILSRYCLGSCGSPCLGPSVIHENCSIGIFFYFYKDMHSLGGFILFYFIYFTFYFLNFHFNVQLIFFHRWRSFSFGAFPLFERQSFCVGQLDFVDGL